MPICVSCAQYAQYLYTLYQSGNNLRLERCASCKNFVDPYVEHDELIILLDLILLKRGVYRHLLFNRGYPPRRILDGDGSVQKGKGGHADAAQQAWAIRDGLNKARWNTIVRLGGALILVDAFIRWSHLDLEARYLDPLHQGSYGPLIRLVAGCIIETLAFHVGIVIACAIILRIRDTYHKLFNRSEQKWESAVLQEFRISHIPLMLLYSSMTKLFLLFLLSIWKPAASRPSTESHHQSPLICAENSGNVPESVCRIVEGALNLFDEKSIDRDWIVRNLIGGMATGFGLKVALDVHPVFTTVVIFFGWGIKSLVANLLDP